MKKYLISGALTNDLKYADVLPKDPYLLKDEESQHCPKCGELSYGLKWVAPYSVSFNRKTIGDITLWSPLIVNQKFKSIYESNALTGIKNFHTIEKATYRGKEIEEKLYIIELERTQIYTNYRKTKYKGSRNENKLCSICNPNKKYIEYINGIFFDRDFEFDIFYSYDWGNIVFISERFVTIMLSNGITNLEKNIEECENYISPKWPQEDYEKAKKLRKA